VPWVSSGCTSAATDLLNLLGSISVHSDVSSIFLPYSLNFYFFSPHTKRRVKQNKEKHLNYK
jgi:hypothetical protein